MVKGYKAFLPDWTCRPDGGFKQYSCPGMFEQNGKLGMCGNGMHFCKEITDCLYYVTYTPDLKIAEVIAHGDVIERGAKCCTNKLEVVKEISPEEYLAIAEYAEILRKVRHKMMFEWWEKITAKSPTTI